MGALLSVANLKRSPKLYENHAILWDCQGQPVLVEGTRPYLIVFIMGEMNCSFNDALQAYRELAVR